MRLREFGWITFGLGLIALLILSPLGITLAAICLVSIIGIPIFLVMAVIPTLALWCLLTFLAWLALEFAGNRTSNAAWGISAAIATAALVLVPHVQNTRIMSITADLTRADKTGTIEPWRGKTLAVFVPQGHDAECHDFCQRVLVSGAATTFIVARAKTNGSEPNFAATGLAYRLEPRQPCAPVKFRDTVRDFYRTDDAAAAAPAMRLAIAQGQCLVKSNAPVDTADGILMRAQLRENIAKRRPLDPFAMPIAAQRLTFFRKRGTQYATEWRQTSVQYQTLFPVLLPTFNHGNIFSMHGTLLRQDGNTMRDLDAKALVRDHLKMALTTRDTDLAATREATIAEARRASGAIEPAVQALVNDAFAALGANGAAIDMARVAQAMSLIQDARVAVPAALNQLVQATRTAQEPIRAIVISGLFDRLDLEIAAASHAEANQRRLNLGNLAQAVGAVIKSDLAGHWPRIRVIRRDGEAIAAFTSVIRQSYRAGRAAMDDVLQIIDLAAGRPQFRPARPNQRAVVYAALASICKVGVDAIDLRPQIEARVLSGVIHTAHVGDWTAVAQTLAAVGGDPDWLRPIVKANDTTGRWRTDLDKIIERAKQKSTCAFS